MKEIIGKTKCNNETLPKHLIVEKIEIHEASLLQKNLTNFMSTLYQILLTKSRNVTQLLNRIFQQ